MTDQEKLCMDNLIDAVAVMILCGENYDYLMNHDNNLLCQCVGALEKATEISEKAKRVLESYHEMLG